jgi:hypothetical protein
MKRFFAVFFLILLCHQTVFALQHYVGQFYEGEAKPRAEVAWIWVGNSPGSLGATHFDGIDGSKISTMHDYHFWKAIEVLPGKHIVAVSYEDISGYSQNDQMLEIDAKAGESYVILGKTESHWRGGNQWQAGISAFTPEANETGKLKREKLERSESVDGVVQSWAHATLVLSIPASSQTRKFKILYDLRAAHIAQPDGAKARFIQPTGTKVRVFYFPSHPEEAATVNVVE